MLQKCHLRGIVLIMHQSLLKINQTRMNFQFCINKCFDHDHVQSTIFKLQISQIISSYFTELFGACKCYTLNINVLTCWKRCPYFIMKEYFELG